MMLPLYTALRVVYATPPMLKRTICFTIHRDARATAAQPPPVMASLL